MTLILGASTILENPLFQGKSPTLFDDYSGRPFNGEGGGLALNDNHDISVYDYIRRFAPILPTIPTPTGDPAKPGISGVNPNAADEFLVIDAAGWDTAINNATYDFIFIAKGTDLKAEAQKTVTVGGSMSTTRWILYWDDVTPSNVQDIKPWNLASGDRVKMPACEWSGTQFMNCVGLTWGEKDSFSNRMGSFQANTDDFTFYRCHKEFTDSTINILWRNISGDRLTVFECAFLDADDSAPDSSEILFQSGDGHRIISCETRDSATFIEAGGQWTGNDCVIEDCDIYKQQYYDNLGNKDAMGNFMFGETAIGFKRLDAAGVTIKLRIYGNRFWGFRQPDAVLDPGNDSGFCIGSSDNSLAKTHVDARWNVFQDNTRTCIRFAAGSILAGTTNHSVVRNIIGEFPAQTGGSSSQNYPLYLGHDKTEVYLNTISDAADADGFIQFFRTDAGVSDLDMMGNFMQDTDQIDQDFDTGNQIGYNSWTNAFEIVNLVYGNDITPSKASLNMGDFTYIRRKLTGAENSTIVGIVPTSSTPTSFLTLVPTTGGSGNDQIGSRTDIGVDDLF